jgi:hypothetical protein
MIAKVPHDFFFPIILFGDPHWNALTNLDKLMKAKREGGMVREAMGNNKQVASTKQLCTDSLPQRGVSSINFGETIAIPTSELLLIKFNKVMKLVIPTASTTVRSVIPRLKFVVQSIVVKHNKVEIPTNDTMNSTPNCCFKFGNRVKLTLHRTAGIKVHPKHIKRPFNAEASQNNNSASFNNQKQRRHQAPLEKHVRDSTQNPTSMSIVVNPKHVYTSRPQHTKASSSSRIRMCFHKHADHMTGSHPKSG